MLEQRATNIYWHDGAITRSDRELLNGHRGFTIWFTGLSASGKSTLAVATEKGLIVPTIYATDRLSLHEIAKIRFSLVEIFCIIYTRFIGEGALTLINRLVSPEATGWVIS